MAPAIAEEKIQHLLISTTENGFQEHESLLAAYEEFNAYLEKNKVKKPVVLLSDGHSSRFDDDVLQYLEDQQIRLFIGPPDTTGVTQLLDQTNQSLHKEYREKKGQLFSPFATVDKDGFMTILANMWDSWTTPVKLINAAKRVSKYSVAFFLCRF